MKSIFAISSALILLLINVLANNQVRAATAYKCISSDGETSFSSTRCESGSTEEQIQLSEDANVLESQVPVPPPSESNDTSNSTDGVTIGSEGNNKSSTGTSGVNGSTGSGGSTGGGSSSGGAGGGESNSGNNNTNDGTSEAASDSDSNGDSSSEAVTESTTTTDQNTDTNSPSVPSGDDNPSSNVTDNNPPTEPPEVISPAPLPPPPPPPPPPAPPEDAPTTVSRSYVVNINGDIYTFSFRHDHQDDDPADFSFKLFLGTNPDPSTFSQSCNLVENAITVCNVIPGSAKYYFAVKANDGVNDSSVSNVVEQDIN